MVFDHSIGVVVGLAAEARIARRLGWPVAISGATAAGATLAAEHLLAVGCKALLSFGLAGGLDPSLRPGDLIVPTAVIAGDARYGTDARLSSLLGGTTPCVLLGCNEVLASVVAKRRTSCRTSAVAADTESGAVARITTTHGLPFAVLRAICDPAERDLPPAALTAIDADGAIRFRCLAGSLIRQPGQLPALFRLAIDAATARRSLARRVRTIVQAGLR